MCTHGDVFSLAVLIGRGLDHNDSLVNPLHFISNTLFSFQGVPELSSTISRTAFFVLSTYIILLFKVYLYADFTHSIVGIQYLEISNYFM